MLDGAEDHDRWPAAAAVRRLGRTIDPGPFGPPPAGREHEVRMQIHDPRVIDVERRRGRTGRGTPRHAPGDDANPGTISGPAAQASVDADEVVGEPERDDDLGCAREEGDDAHGAPGTTRPATREGDRSSSLQPCSGVAAGRSAGSSRDAPAGRVRRA